MKTNRIIYSAAFVILSLVLLHASAAFAEIKPGSINLTTSLGGYKVDSGLHYDNGLDWGLGAGLNFSEKLGAEFNFNSVDSESGGNSGKILLYRLDLLYHIRRLPSGKTIPYVSCGTGFASYKNKGVGNRKEYNFILDPGFGVKHYISKNFALRGDARYIIDVNGDSLYHSFLLNAGLLFEFSLDEEEPIPPPPVEPAAEPVREEICPQGPEGCTQKDWCKTDSDGDGVPDCLDKCPDTPVGVKVDAQGCPPAEEQGVIIFRNILFDFARSNIRPESHAVLDEVADYMDANKGVKMEIQGHTDNKGTAQYNMNLSYRRADSVRKYIAGKGISPERLKVSGFGFSKPVVPNDSDENRSRNRRVEFIPF